MNVLLINTIFVECLKKDKTVKFRYKTAKDERWRMLMW